MPLIITGDNENNQLYGGHEAETLLGLHGDDTLYGGDGNDTLVGGAGNDQLDGHLGDNTYVFNRGDGIDTIFSFDHRSTKQNVIAFGAAIAPADILAMRDNEHLRLINSKTGDVVLVHRFFVSQTDYGLNAPFGPWGIEQVTFETGERWTYTDILKLAAGPAQALGPGDDFAFGRHLQGLGGDDTLHAQDASVLSGGAGNDRLLGSFADDLLDGGTGNDLLDGAGGNNVFVFGRGFGQDRIMLREWGGYTEIRLGAMLAGELAVSRSENGNGPDLVLTAKTGSDSITLVGYFLNPNAGASVSVVFADGAAWTGPQLNSQLYRPPGLTIAGTADAEQLSGSWDNDVLIGNGGVDQLSGQDGDDVLIGGSDMEMMEGGEGNDTYLPGAGNAFIHIKGGNDLLVFGREAGTYQLFDLWQAKSLTIAVAPGVTPSDIVFVRPGNGELYMEIAGSTARIVLPEMMLHDPIFPAKISVVFDDGQLWSGEALRSAALSGGEMPDVLRGTFFGDIIQGHGERDVLEGMGGDDRLFGGAGDDLVMGMEGNDSLYGGDGNDELFGHMGDDVLVGGAGIDHLNGGEGHNTYVFSHTDYLDFVMLSPWYGGAAGTETIQFEGHVDPATLSVKFDSTMRELTLSTPYNQQMVILRNFDFEPNSPNSEVFVRFADGTRWNREQLRERTLVGDEQDNVLLGTSLADVLVGKGGHDLLRGMSNDDTLEGGRGNDMLDGGEGKDTYRFDKGDGEDFVTEVFAMPEHRSVFQFGPNVSAADIRIETVGSTLSIKYGNGDRIVIENVNQGQAYADFILGTQIELVVGAPATLGSYLPVGQVAPVTLTGTAGADVLIGKSNDDSLTGLGGDDTLDGGLGADRMSGNLGNDTYKVDNAGDLVIENASEGSDTVIASISYVLPANVEKLTLAGTAALNGTGNSLNNNLLGNSGANRLDGGAGMDSMIGGDGNDVYLIDSSYDTGNESSANGFDQLISTVSRTLGANQEMLTLSGAGFINGTGNTAANVIQGTSGANLLNGGEGSDILQGGAGDDTLIDASSKGNLFDGGSGADRLTGNTGADMFIGGAGNDSITTGSGVDVIAFNRGDGVDTVAVASGSDNIVSLGGAIRYADLALGKGGNDLILHLGKGESITFKGWYSSTNARSVGTLQVMTEGGDYLGAGSAITDHKVELFNFNALVAKFDQLRVSNPSQTTWSMASSMASFSTGGSDSAAIGGDLAYQYGAGTLSVIGAMPALAIIGSPSFGTSQALQGSSGLNDGTPMLY